MDFMDFMDFMDKVKIKSILSIRSIHRHSPMERVRGAHKKKGAGSRDPAP